MSTYSASARFSALQDLGHRPSQTRDWAKTQVRVIDLFGSSTFNAKVMKEKLNKKVYNKLQDTIKRGAKLDQSIADDVANAVKEVGGRAWCQPFHPLVSADDRHHRREARRIPQL